MQALFFAGAAAVAAVLWLGAAGADEQAPAPLRLEPFDYQDVSLADGPFRTAFEANRRYLLSLDPDSLLYVFRENAGLPNPGKPLGGWEASSCLVRGQFVGHYLSACARTVAACGDRALKAKADAVVAGLAQAQEALGDGYLSAFPSTILDAVEGKTQGQVWAPYYVQHKIMVGLLEMHLYAGNEQALAVLRKMADYIGRRIEQLNDQQMARMLEVEHGGMAEVLYSLYAVTREPRHLALARRFEQRAFLDPIAEGRDTLGGIHANTNLPKICGAARAYELTGEERYRRIVSNFWHLLRDTRSYATGGSSVGELWPPAGTLNRTLCDSNEETCTTYNWLKITQYLLNWSGQREYADRYERALYNGILPVQNPETGMITYFLPLGAGYTKTFGTPLDSFWCCYGTAVQAFADLNHHIYFHAGDALIVNLFVPSTVRWKLGGREVRVEQRTRFPEEDRARLVIHADKPVKFSLKLRIPGWTEGWEATLNGRAVKGSQGQGFASIARTWRDGDTVEVRLPMRLRLEAMKDDPDLVALLYGPIVLAGLVDRDMPLIAAPKDLDRWLVPDGQPLAFHTSGLAQQVRFIPLYRIIGEKYGVYFRVFAPGSAGEAAWRAQQERLRERLARTVDSVRIGDAESERAHNLQGEKTIGGSHYTGRWRHAEPGGFFAYDLAVDPNARNILVVTYWGSDVGRTFDILVDGQRIATQTLNNNKPDELFEVEHPLPADLVAGKQKITVRFEGRPASLAGGVFGLAVVRGAAPVL